MKDLQAHVMLYACTWKMWPRAFFFFSFFYFFFRMDETKCYHENHSQWNI